MSRFPMWAVWAVALCLTAAGAWPLAALGRTTSPDDLRADVVVVGTSLTTYGLPPTGDGLLPGTGSFERVDLQTAQPADVVAALGQALDARPDAVVVELNFFLLEAHWDARRPGRPPYPWLAAVKDVSWQLRTGQEALLGGSAIGDPDAGPRRHAEDVLASCPSPSAVSVRAYPPDAELQQVLARARALGTEVAFLLVPQSRCRSDLLGDEAIDRLQVLADGFGREYGVEVLAPGPVWPDAEYLDVAHLNASGRARLLAALQQGAPASG